MTAGAPRPESSPPSQRPLPSPPTPSSTGMKRLSLVALLLSFASLVACDSTLQPGDSAEPRLAAFAFPYSDGGWELPPLPNRRASRDSHDGRAPDRRRPRHGEHRGRPGRGRYAAGDGGRRVRTRTGFGRRYAHAGGVGARLPTHSSAHDDSSGSRRTAHRRRGRRRRSGWPHATHRHRHRGPPGPTYYAIGLYRPADPDFQGVNWSAVGFESEDPILRTSPADVGGIDLEGEPVGFSRAYFDDRTFDGERGAIRIEVPVRFGGAPRDVHVVVTAMSPEHFRYHRHLALQGRGVEDVLSEPAGLYTNIEGGVGIFAAYANTVQIVSIEGV